MWPPTLYWRSAILGLIQLFAAHSIEPSAFATSVQAQPNPTLIMEGSLRHPASDKYLLHVKIINRQKVSVSVLNGDLPWQTPNEFVLIPRGYRLDAEKSLMVRGGPFVHYMDIAHTLAPGQSLEGDITLHNMFRTLLSDVDKFGVVIEWSCKAKPLHLVCPEGPGGAFTISQGGSSPEVSTR